MDIIVVDNMEQFLPYYPPDNHIVINYTEENSVAKIYPG